MRLGQWFGLARGLGMRFGWVWKLGLGIERFLLCFGFLMSGIECGRLLHLMDFVYLLGFIF